MSRTMMLLALAAAVSPGFAQKVRVDYDHGSDYSHYKTYRWVGMPRASSPDVQFPNQLMQQRIVSFVEEALAAKRLTRVETGGDLLVNYDVEVTAEPQLTTFSDASVPFAGGLVRGGVVGAVAVGVADSLLPPPKPIGRARSWSA